MIRDEDNRWLLALQRDIPIEARPFAVLGEAHGMSEDEVLQRIDAMFTDGSARRLGAVFDVRRLGYRSSLCAVGVPPPELDACAAQLVDLPGMTHCYHRGWPDDLPRDSLGAPPAKPVLPSLWFTISERESSFDATMTDVVARLAPYPLHILPATRRFKIDVVFDPASRHQGELFPGVNGEKPAPEAPHMQSAMQTPEFSAEDQRLVRRLQGQLPITREPYATVADELGMPRERLLARLQEWKATGILRRVGIIMRHRQLGFSANGMCTWDVPMDDALRAGRALAAFSEVTHCYERPRLAAFPYNLFAMIHAGSYSTAVERYQQLTDAAGLETGCVLFSLKEYKKTSPQYFTETN